MNGIGPVSRRAGGRLIEKSLIYQEIGREYTKNEITKKLNFTVTFHFVLRLYK